MEPETKLHLRNFQNMSKQKKLLLSGIIVVIILLIATVYLSRVLLNNPMVYSGVYLDGISLEGFDKIELSQYISKKYNVDMSSLQLSIYHKNYPVTVRFDELGAHVDKELILNKVYSIGRQGNFIKRLIDIYKLRENHVYLETDVYINEQILDGIINEIYENTYTAPDSPSLLLLENEVIILSGKPGYAIKKELLKERILKQISKLESGIVIVPVEKIPPVKIEADTMYNKIVREPQNASVILMDGEIEIIPEVTGRKIDKAEFLSLIAEMEAKSVNYPVELKLPVDFIEPDITAEKIENSLFRDILSTYSSEFSTENEKNRSVNIRLAAEAINGTILFPGETFSFNDKVGQRTAEKGYLPANIYTQDEITTGIGGGICQVSSTLYNAALKANLEIVERNPHIFMVAYVPLGCDATVSYGTEDLKFTNNTNWPVRIDGQVTSDNKVEFFIVGTNENPSLEAVVQSTVIRLIPYDTEYIETDNLPGGSQKLIQKGMNGAVVDTYLIVRKDNEVISNYKLHSTTYKPLPEIIQIGKKK